MRRILLTSVAVTALLAGPALAQSPPEPKQSPGASSQQSTPSPKSNADREKGQKASQSQTGSSTSGQGAAPKGKDDSKAAQEQRGPKSDQGMSQKSEKSDKGKSQENRSNAAQKSGASDSAQKSGASDNERSKDAQTTPSGQKGQPKQTQGPKNERSTTGQSSSDQPTKGDRMNRDNANPQGQNRNEQGRTQQGESRTGTSSGTAGQSGSTSKSTSQESRSSASANPEVQSKFSETIEKRNIKTTTNVNVEVSVGRTIPRSVTVYDVPTDIVRINPEFRGKKFTVVRDEIVIIEPSTHKVVSVIPRSGRSTSGTSTTTGTSTSVRQSSSRVDLSPEKRRTIRETVLKEQSAPRCQDVQVTVGSTVSSGIRFTPFPELVTREVPEIRSYQYCIHNDDVVLIDPSDRRVVELLD